MPTITLPPITDAHRRAAFTAMHWPGWTFETAMRFDLRRKLVEARASHLRTNEYKAQHPQAPAVVRRYNPATGQWCCQQVPGQYRACTEPELI